MAIRLSFFGAAGTVTGSRYLLQAGDTSILIDCGLFQGNKELRLRNWSDPMVHPARVSGIVLTHAHIDHSGYLPRFVKLGFRGPIHCTAATRDLTEILLLDSAHIQEEDADFYNRKGISKHKPAVPLYTTEDATRAIRLLQPHPYNEWIQLSGGVSFRFLSNGHILGSAMVHVQASEGSRKVSLLFSGDLGRYGMPLHPDPLAPADCEYLVLESTYGNRLHCADDPLDMVERVVRSMLERNAVLLIPSFGIGRAQQITVILKRLLAQGRIPEFPVYIDSPMAVDATQIYCRYPDEHRLPPPELDTEECRLCADNVHLVRSREESMKLNDFQGPGIIIASSGMLNGGRVLHHLKRLVVSSRNQVALIGFQAYGTLGRALIDGARSVRIHKQLLPVNAEIVDLCGFSGHADAAEIERWLGALSKPPRITFITHGEPDSSEALAARLRKIRFICEIPELGSSVEL